MVPTPGRFVPVRNRLWRGLIPQLVILIILPLTIVLLVIAFGSLSLHQKAMRDLVGERDERAVRSVARAINEQLDHHLDSIRGLAQRATDRSTLHDILTASAYLLPDFDGGLAFFSTDGSLLATLQQNQPVPSPTLMSILGRAGPEPHFSMPFVAPSTNEIWMLVAASVGQETVAVGTFSVTALISNTLAAAFITGDQASAFVVDANTQIVFQTGSLVLDAHTGDHPGVNEALLGEAGTTYLQQAADGSEHVVAFSPITPVGWALVIEERWELVDSPLLRTTQFAPLVLIPPFLLALVALWFGVRQIVEPLQTLAAKAAELAWGRFEPIEQPVGGIFEIRRLQAELIHMAQKVKVAQESLRDYISAITRGQEEERRRLARELHDDTLQALIALNQRAQLAHLSLAQSPAAIQIAEIQALTEQTIGNLRRLTRALRPIYLEDLGLVTALDMLAKETSQNTMLPVEFHRVGQERRLASEVELALYRMAQEALNNVVRHAQASRGSLTIRFQPDTVVMIISDDGRGFKVPDTPAAFAPHGHFGLLGLHERAELIGARLSIQSSLGHGTQEIITLPVSLADA